MKEIEINRQRDCQQQSSKEIHTENILEEKENPRAVDDQIVQAKFVTPFTIPYQRGRRHVFAASKRQGAMHSSSKLVKDKITKTVKDKVTQTVKRKVTKSLRSKGKLPKKDNGKKPMKDKG